MTQISCPECAAKIDIPEKQQAPTHDAVGEMLQCPNCVAALDEHIKKVMKPKQEEEEDLFSIADDEEEEDEDDR